jgi:hypothetical protein
MFCISCKISHGLRYVACLFLSLFNGVLAFYAIQQVAQAGWSPVCLEYAGHNCFFTSCVRYIYYILILVDYTLIIYLFG